MENAAQDDRALDLPNADPDDTSPAVDAIVQVRIDSDGLTAYINIEPPLGGGAAPTLEALNKALSGNGIKQNIDVAKINELASNPVYNSDIVVANGRAPVNGVDGTASFQFETDNKGINLRENDAGKVDFGDLNIVQNVRKGQTLCIITLPTEGSEGISVKGKALPQKKGKPVPPYAGKNTELTEDGTSIVAKIDGPVEFDGKKISVKDVFYINGDIDTSTGNINVASSLVVSGMVMPGFKIEAGENIEIKETAERATIHAGGNVKLLSGITGSELHCGGDLSCHYIENCNIFVKGNISAEYILNSNIKCGKNLKTVGMRSKIIGGNCIAGMNIETGIAGSISNIKTRLEIGTDSSVMERQQELKDKISELEKKTESIKPLLSILRQLEESGRMTEEKQKALENVTYTYETDTEALDNARKELNEISQAIQSKGYGKITCRDTIHPGTTIAIGLSNLVVTETLTNALIYYDEGEIKIGSAR